MRSGWTGGRWMNINEELASLLIDVKNGNRLLTISSWRRLWQNFLSLLCICYCFSHLIGLFSITWLFLLFKIPSIFNLFSVSLWRRTYTLETYDFISVSAVHQPFHQFRLVFLYIYIHIYTVPTTFIFQYNG